MEGVLSRSTGLGFRVILKGMVLRFRVGIRLGLRVQLDEGGGSTF